MHRFLLASSLLVVFALVFPSSVSAEVIQSIVSLNSKPNLAVFNDLGGKKLLEIKSADGLAKYFDEKQIGAITKQVNFKHQVVLILAWRGSGKDRLGFEVAESDPEQIAFHIKNGRTKDLRFHMHVFAVRAVATWSVR